MQIIANNGARILEHDQILRRLLAQRAQEWQNQSGFRRLFIRIKVEIWVWRETHREMHRTFRSHSPRKF